ncbi:MAG: FeoA domain-containing protein [Pirellulales bacterium]|nr:FeoA domain-containing protein [Pirellulales bacterium]
MLPSREMLPLQCLAAGQQGRISQLLGSPEQVHRLEEIGMRQGVLVEMLQSGSPCIVRLGGQKLCFRADDLMRVLVEP